MRIAWAVTAALGAKENREKAPPELREVLQMIDPALENLPQIADSWYSALTTATRRHAPNHLIFGDKIVPHRDLPGSVQRPR